MRGTLFVLFGVAMGGCYRLPAQTLDSALASNARIDFQRKETVSFCGNTIFFSNRFSGGRFNGVDALNDSTFLVTVSPENKPVNASPWYAFKVWGTTDKTISIRLQYTYAKHRYDPKVSHDGLIWKRAEAPNLKADTSVNNIVLRVRTSPDTLWVAAQEVVSSRATHSWIDSLAAHCSFVKQETIGYSTLNKPIPAFRVNKKHRSNVVVIASRQHPPEVTGYKAMQAFVERAAGNTRLARAFREKFDVVVFPMLNPDGVDLGHWRHNARGVDINRDWKTFAQPETSAVRDFLVERVRHKKDSIWFCLDFHSTAKDVYYVVTDDPNSLTQRWLAAVGRAIPENRIHQTFHGVQTATLKNWIYGQFGAEAVTYEVGDATDRGAIKRIGETAADELMKLLLEELDKKRSKK